MTYEFFFDETTGRYKAGKTGDLLDCGRATGEIYFRKLLSEAGISPKWSIGAGDYE
jgi:hypothetical protein